MENGSGMQKVNDGCGSMSVFGQVTPAVLDLELGFRNSAAGRGFAINILRMAWARVSCPRHPT